MLRCEVCSELCFHSSFQQLFSEHLLHARCCSGCWGFCNENRESPCPQGSFFSFEWKKQILNQLTKSRRILVIDNILEKENQVRMVMVWRKRLLLELLNWEVLRRAASAAGNLLKGGGRGWANV